MGNPKARVAPSGTGSGRFAPENPIAVPRGINLLDTFSDAQRRKYLKHVKLRSVDNGAKFPTPARMAHERIVEGKDHHRLLISMLVLLMSAVAAGILGLLCSCSVSKAFGSGCLLVALFTLLGLYGWHRVPNDVLNDLDGLETPGQHVLQIFFHATWILMSLLVLSTGSVLVSSHADTACPSATGLELAKAGVALCMLMIPAAALSMLYSLRIVTWYMILQSLQELCCLWTLLGAVLILVASLMMRNRVAFISASVDLVGDPIVWVAVAVSWSLLQIPVSIYGFAAGWVEGKRMLRLHSFLSIAMIFFAVVIFAEMAAKTYDANLSGTISQCASVLKLMGRDWFHEYFACEKYLPTGVADELRPPVCERLPLDPAPAKLQTSITWETITFSGTLADVCTVGCVDAGCCERVSAAIFTLKTMVAGGGLWYLTVMLVGFTASLDLYREIADDGKVLHHHRSAKIAITMGVFVCVALGVAFGTQLGSNFAVMQESMRSEACNYDLLDSDSVDPNTTISSCENGLLDGNEIGIDCGGGQCQACFEHPDDTIEGGTPTVAPISAAPTEAPITRPTPAPSSIPSAAPTRTPTRPPMSAPTVTPSMAPTLSPTTEDEPMLTVQLIWNDGLACSGDTCDVPSDIDLKVRFIASGGKACTVSGVANETRQCGEARHLGDVSFDSADAVTLEETIEVDKIAQSLYVFYIENRRLDRPTELANAVLSVTFDGTRQETTYALPAADAVSYDLLGYHENQTWASISEVVSGSGDRSTSYAFARIFCLDGNASAPTLFACPRYFLDDREDRVHRCTPGETCSECGAKTWFWDRDDDAWGDPSSKVSTCQDPDEDMLLVKNALDCDDTDATVGNCSVAEEEEKTYKAGWYVDPFEMSSTARSCDDVCESFELSCQTEEMATISDPDSCLEKTRLAFTGWCSPQDLEYTSASFANPLRGGVLQMSAQAGRARCACAKGTILGLDGGYAYSTEEELGFQDDRIDILGDVLTVEAQRNEAYVDLGATCNDPLATLTTSGDTVDLSTTGTYVITYSCCVDDECAERARYVTVNGAESSCDDFLAGVGVSESNRNGGCIVYKKMSSSMNNVHVGFPYPQNTVEYCSASGVYASKCGAKPDYATERRVCYCG